MENESEEKMENEMKAEIVLGLGLMVGRPGNWVSPGGMEKKTNTIYDVRVYG